MVSTTLHDPLWLLALLALPLVFWLRSQRKLPVRIVPFAAAWHRPSPVNASRLPMALAVLGIALLVIALARPQRVEDRREVRQEGYDLILAIDLSGSMLSEDYERRGEPLNRLQAIQPVIRAFIDERRGDRIGIVVFSGRAYTLAPLTFDHDWLDQQVDRLKPGLIEDGTALGDGLGVALSRLEQKQRTEGDRRLGAFVILLTDGANNVGVLQPMDAAKIAQARGIPVYTIGAGRSGYTRMPIMDPQTREVLGHRTVMSDLDENTLRQIAEATGATYFRADAPGTVEDAFAAIDAAQKIEFSAQSHLLSDELFMWFAIPGALCLLLAAALAHRQGGRHRSVHQTLTATP
jgi:Ca-activated chloride channel family protein